MPLRVAVPAVFSGGTKVKGKGKATAQLLVEVVLSLLPVVVVEFLAVVFLYPFSFLA